jgi:hypothetical protein
MNVEIEREFKIYFKTKEDAALFSISEESTAATFNFGFDYRCNNHLKDNWTIMIDAEIQIDAIASILYRVEYKALGEISQLLVDDVLTTIIDQAFISAVFCFREHCRMEGIETIPDIKLDNQILSDMSSTMRQLFIERETTYNANINLHTQDGGHFTAGKNTTLFIQSTFLVMDQILFANQNLNCLENRSILFETIGIDISRYITLRLYCIEIVEHTIKLSFYQMIYLFILVDCAAQILLSPILEIIQSELTDHGLTNELINDYFSIAAEIRQQLNTEMKNSGTSVDLLNKTYNWPSLINY